MPEMTHKTVNNIADHYKVLLNYALNSEAMNQVSTLAGALLDGWLGRKTFTCVEMVVVQEMRFT